MTWLLLSLFVSYAPTRDVGVQLDAEGETRVMKLGQLLRCAVCQGVSIADSPAPMAQAQLSKVRELVSEGKTDDEILSFFVDRYGEWVLLEPTKTGLNAFLWAGPLALLGIGLLVIFSSQRRTNAAVASLPGGVPSAGEKEDDALLQKVRADAEGEK